MKALSPLRVGRVTASRVPAILGLSPYRTRDDTLREMVREVLGAESEFVSNPAVEWGNDHEADAITAFERSTGRVVSCSGDDQITVVHPEHDWLAATPDGLLDDGELVEVKCPWKAFYTSIDERPDYYAQIQMQLACTGRSWGWFVVWRPTGLSVSEVPADNGWLERHLPTLLEFREDVVAVLDDPSSHGRFVGDADPQREDFDWQVAALEFLEADAALKRAEAAKVAARSVLLALAGERSDKGAGVQVIRADRKGQIDSAAVLRDHCVGVDLELYRKPSSVVYTVRAVASP